MFNIFKKKPQNNLIAPVSGNLIKIEDVSDEVFSTKVMGDGFAIKPSSDKIVSPVDGEITSVFPTKHAITISTKDGLEVLLHLGIDTVELKGTPFDMKVEQGQTVTAGDELVEMDREEINNNGKEDTVILVLPGKSDVVFEPAVTNKMIESGEVVTAIK